MCYMSVFGFPLGFPLAKLRRRLLGHQCSSLALWGFIVFFESDSIPVSSLSHAHMKSNGGLELSWQCSGSGLLRGSKPLESPCQTGIND